MTREIVRRTLFWTAGLALPCFVSCSDDAGTAEIPRGKTSFGGSYSGPVTGPGTDAALPSPPDGGPSGDAPSVPKVDCDGSEGAWDCTCAPGSTQACTCGDGGPAGTQTCRPSGAGYNPCDCGTPTNDQLGAPCTADGDCGVGLICLTAASTMLDGQAPPGGLCTRECAGDGSVCEKTKAGAKCVGFPDQTSASRYCLEACSFGEPAVKADKCHGRLDFACAPLVVPGLGEVGKVCMPNCNSDEDCTGGYVCDPGSGRCYKGSAPTGDAVGAQCSQTGSDTCHGYCEKLDLSLPSTSTTLCAERCTAGALAAQKTSCGWKTGTATPAQAACIYYSGANITPGTGDRGACGQLCDCNSQCTASGLVCQPLPSGLDTLFKRKGQCSPPKTGATTGIVSCT